MAWLVLAYAGIFFSRSEAQVAVRFFSFDLGGFPRWAAWAIHGWGWICFYGGTVLLLKGYASGNLKSLEIWGRHIEVTPETRWVVLRSLWVTAVGLIGSLGVSLVPGPSWAPTHIDLGAFAVVIATSSLTSAIWARWKVRQLARRRIG